MRTKICGITSYEDAMMAIDAGADAIGFVLYEPSPRYITPSKAKDIIEKLPPFIEKVALFVNESPQHISTTSHKIGATLAQLHFEVDDDFCSQLSIPYIKVVRAKSSEDILQYADEYRLIDAYCESYGGAGKRLNLEWFQGLDCSKIILAGGLNAENVATLKSYGFYGVDVSSGVEAAKGIKDKTKVQKFIANAQI